MNLSALFIRRPVGTSLFMAAIVIAGALAYRQLPVSDLPTVDFPTIQVTAQLPGGDPATMAATVASPLERQFSTIAGLDAMSSSSGQGVTTITLQFALERDIDAAAQDVQAAISRAQRSLPTDMPAPPYFQKVNPADQPIVYLSLTSPTLPLPMLDDYAQNMIGVRLSTISGVAQVSVFGTQKYAVRIQADPQALAARGIGIDEVAAAIRNGNVELPTGTLYGGRRTLTVKSEGQLENAAAFAQLIVAHRDGAPVRLADVARVIDSVENDKNAAWYCTATNVQRAIVLGVQKQPGVNTVEVCRKVKELIPGLQAQMPKALELKLLFDRSVPIQESFDEVRFTLLLTGALVVLVIFAFLRHFYSTVIPSLALPVSVIGTLAVIHLFGYSLNNLTLMSLTLAIGFVVDDAIVMLENIVRHLEMGKAPRQAAFDGSREVGFTILSMTLSLAAVFIPVLFMAGIVGRLFREFSVTIAVAILISGVISLTLTPMLCALFLKPQPHREGARRTPGDRLFDGVLAGYGRSLRWALRHPLLSLLVTAAIGATTVWLFKTLPKGFLPNVDQGLLFVQSEADEGVSHTRMFELKRQLIDVVRQDPNVEAFMASAGLVIGRGGLNSGRMLVRLKPREERELSADQVVQGLRPKLGAVPGIRAFPQNPPLVQIGGRATRSPYQVTLSSPDTAALYESAAALYAKLRNVPELTDLATDLQLKNPELRLEIDRDRASALGLTARQIETALQYAYAASQVSSIHTPNDEYDVLLETIPELQRDPAALSLLHVRSANGSLVPLRAVTRMSEAAGPLSVNHAGQLPSVTISFNTPPGVSLGAAVDAIKRVADESLPAGISTAFQGAAQAFQASAKGMGWMLLLAIAVIYIVLGILYESYAHPVTILSALPLAGAGALLTLWLFKLDLDVYAFVGLIMLVGLVKKNGIMMVDFAIEEQRRSNATPADAIHAACLVRFRPIMMTTFAALMGALPLALGLGAGSESRRPLGLAVVGGLLFSQTLTLYITPVFYLYMDRLRVSRPARRWLLGLLLVGVGLAGWKASAAEPPAPRPLPLREAVLGALEHNSALRVQRIGPDIAKTYVEEGRAPFDATVTGDLSGGRRETRNLGPSGAIIERRETAADGAAGLERVLPSGTRLGVGASASLVDAEPGSNALYSAGLAASVTQPLLEGRGSDVNLASVRQAELAVRMSEWELRGYTEALAADVEAAYWRLALAGRRVRIHEEAVRVAEQQLAETQERIRVGKLAPVERAAAEAEVARRREALVTARGVLAAAQLRLTRLVDPRFAGGWNAVWTLEELPEKTESAGTTPDEAVAQAMKRRSDLQEARLAIKRGDLELVKTKNGLLPRLDLFVSLGKTGYADAFGPAAGHVVEEDTYEAIAGLLYRQPLGRRDARARQQRAVLEKAAAEEALRNMERLAEHDVRSAWVALETARAAREAAAATRIAQEAAFAAEQEKFRVGYSTSLLVAQAQRDLLTSRVNEWEAAAAWTLALVELRRAQGVVLDRWGIQTPAPEP